MTWSIFDHTCIYHVSSLYLIVVTRSLPTCRDGFKWSVSIYDLPLNCHRIHSISPRLASECHTNQVPGLSDNVPNQIDSRQFESGLVDSVSRSIIAIYGPTPSNLQSSQSRSLIKLLLYTVNYVHNAHPQVVSRLFVPV